MDPNLGRFITEDPIKDGTNWYIYVNNNPLRYTDPTGLISIEGATVSDNDVFDAWDTQTLVSEKSTKQEAQDLNNLVNFSRAMANRDDSFTLQLGVTGTIGGGTTVTGSAGIAIAYDDKEGTFEIAPYTVAGSGLTGGLALSGGLELVISDNNELSDLSGVTHTYGASVTYGLSLGREQNTPFGETSSLDTTGYSFTFGPGTIAEAHYLVTDTTIYNGGN